MKRKLNINWKYGRLVSICFVFAIEEFIVANFQVENTMDVVVAVGGGEKAPKLMSHGVRVQIEITFVFHCHCESYNSICLCLPIRERCALFPFYCTSFTKCVCVPDFRSSSCSLSLSLPHALYPSLFLYLIHFCLFVSVSCRNPPNIFNLISICVEMIKTARTRVTFYLSVYILFAWYKRQKPI